MASRKAHEAVKTLARDRDERASDLYVEIVQAFISTDLPRCRHLFAVENDAPAVTIAVPPAFPVLVREAASSRKVSPNELIYTALIQHLEGERGASVP